MKSQSHHLSRQLIGIAVLSIIVIGWVISILAIHEALRTPKAWVLWATAALSFSVSVILILARMIVRRDDRITAQVQDELKLAREAAERASRSKSDLLASISHEIRTPMNSVLALAALLKRSDPRPDQKEYCDGIDNAGRALLRIIQDVLDLSRAEAGKINLEITTFDLKKTVQSVNEMIRPAVPEGVTYKTVVDESLPKYFKGDAGKTQQVLLNLLSNAVKFTDFGEICLRVFPVSKGNDVARVRFEVKDTGVGIPNDAIDRLFEPFSQVSPESAKEKLGTGLGLAISKRFVGAMMGAIGVESRAGFGSTFSFEVPLEVVDAKTAEADEIEHIDDLTFDGRVLVVDDNLSNLRVASALLQSLGLNVDTATGGFQALSMIEKSRYDVVLLDCQMPDLSGFDVTESVRRAEAGTSTHVPIVALTAFTSKEMIDRCVHVGMDDFMAKPIDLDQMTTVIGRFITPSGVPKRRVDSENPSERDLGTMLAVDTQALDRLRKLSPPRGEFQSSSDVIEELIRLFTSNTDRTLARMRASVESGTAMELAEAAHSLKSSSTSVGAIRVTALLEKFEAIRHDARIPSETTSLLDQLETECEIARNEIISWWNETKSRASMLNGSPFAR